MGWPITTPFARRTASRAVTSFSQISSDPDVQQTLQSLYGSVDNIDLWVGILSEDHVPGASVGQLAKTIIADQFQRLRDGDRFWYQRVFSGKTLSDLEQTTLADIIQRNTTIKNLQGNVFFMNAEISGQVYVRCERKRTAGSVRAGLAWRES